MVEKDPAKKQKLRCLKCFVTLERLKKDALCDYLIKLIDEKGDEKYRTGQGEGRNDKRYRKIIFYGQTD